jgi:wyosine [tRNA(Phe)-imidazoG37] synthetase (radical SAM superfamily)
MFEEIRDKIIQGPVEHPLYGKSLVLNPTVETHRAHRFPSQALVVTTAAQRIIELSKGGEKIKALIVEGEEDPTVHPDFSEISQNLRDLMKKWFPKAVVALRSQAPDFGRADVRHALGCYSQPTVMLEAGTQKTFAALTKRSPKEFKEKIAGMGLLESARLIVETEFVRGDVDNSKDTEVRNWIKQLKEIRPATVRILTPAKKAKGRLPISKTRISQIADELVEKTGLSVEVEAA